MMSPFLDLKARQPSRSSHAAAIAARYSATAVAPTSQYPSPPMIRMAPSRSKGLEMKNGAPKTVRTKRAAVPANGANATDNQTSAAGLPPIPKPELIQNEARETTRHTTEPVRLYNRNSSM